MGDEIRVAMSPQFHPQIHPQQIMQNFAPVFLGFSNSFEKLFSFKGLALWLVGV
jgi:hypothetical protein